jgi:hypothetical protein
MLFGVTVIYPISRYTMSTLRPAFRLFTVQNCGPRLWELLLCHEKKHLLVAHNKAFDIYLRGVRELANAVGGMAHAEFEFIHNRVRAARQALVKIREQLNDHTGSHGC